MIGDYSNPKYGYNNKTPGNRFLKHHHHYDNFLTFSKRKKFFFEGVSGEVSWTPTKAAYKYIK